MKKYSLINLWKTSPKGPIYVVSTSDSLDRLMKKAGEHDEVVLNFKEDGKLWYSRNLKKPVKTFRAH